MERRKTKELMYFNDCTRVSSISAVKSQPTHSLPLFNRLMLCTVSHSYFKNKNYNKNVSKWSIFLQSADIPALAQISASPAMKIFEFSKAEPARGPQETRTEGQVCLYKCSHIIQVIPALTVVT